MNQPLPVLANLNMKLVGKFSRAMLFAVRPDLRNLQTGYDDKAPEAIEAAIILIAGLISKISPRMTQSEIDIFTTAVGAGIGQYMHRFKNGHLLD